MASNDYLDDYCRYPGAYGLPNYYDPDWIHPSELIKSAADNFIGVDLTGALWAGRACECCDVNSWSVARG